MSNHLDRTSYTGDQSGLSYQDKSRISSHIRSVLDDLRDFAPNLSPTDRMEIYEIVGPIDSEDTGPTDGAHITIDTITSQYLLVQDIKKKVLDPYNSLKHKASARELASLVNSINSLITLFLKHNRQIEALKEVSHVQQAVAKALEGSPPDVQERFLLALESYKAGGA